MSFSFPEKNPPLYSWANIGIFSLLQLKMKTKCLNITFGTYMTSSWSSINLSNASFYQSLLAEPRVTGMQFTSLTPQNHTPLNSHNKHFRLKASHCLQKLTGLNTTTSNSEDFSKPSVIVYVWIDPTVPTNPSCVFFPHLFAGTFCLVDGWINDFQCRRGKEWKVENKAGRRKREAGRRTEKEFVWKI